MVICCVIECKMLETIFSRLNLFFLWMKILSKGMSNLQTSSGVFFLEYKMRGQIQRLILQLKGMTSCKEFPLDVIPLEIVHTNSKRLFWHLSLCAHENSLPYILWIIYYVSVLLHKWEIKLIKSQMKPFLSFHSIFLVQISFWLTRKWRKRNLTRIHKTKDGYNLIPFKF